MSFGVKQLPSNICIVEESFERIQKNKISNYKDFHSFAVIRNPYQRIISAYKKAIKVLRKAKGVRLENLNPKKIFNYEYLKNIRQLCGEKLPSFEEFVIQVSATKDVNIDVHMRSQNYFLKRNGEIVVKQVIKLEDIENGWSDLMKFVKHPVSLGRANQSTSVIECKFTNELYKMINTRYAKDFEIGNYTMRQE